MVDDEALGAEFDLMAAWTAQAVLDLGADHAIPAGCRGSGSADFGPTPAPWAERITEIDRAVDLAHAADPRLGRIRDQERRLGALLDEGTVRSLVLHATRP